MKIQRLIPALLIAAAVSCTSSQVATSTIPAPKTIVEDSTALVTPTGREHLSRAIPRSVAEIEAAVRAGR